jgi:cyclase
MQRVIFTLLYDRGQFMLSRNFRLQMVGSIDWLFSNYDLPKVSHGLDELMVIDVTRGARDSHRFTEAVNRIAGQCFIPLTVGGGITSPDVAQQYLRSGADKLLINTAFANDPALCRTLAARFGRQCIVAGLDYRRSVAGERQVFVDRGTQPAAQDLRTWVRHVEENGAGELLLQSIDQDGTGMGPDLAVVDALGPMPELPIILMGGVGKGEHIIDALKDRRVDAIATANLFNFIGSSFLDVRKAVAAAGIEVAHWDDSAFDSLHGRLATSV